MTQAELAQRAKIACRNLARIESNDGDTTTDVLVALAKELKIEPTALLIVDENPTQPLPNIQPEQGLGRTAV